MVLKLGPKLARDEKLRKFKNELVSELKASTHLRLSQDLTEAVCECIEWRIKKKYKQDKKVLVLQIIAEGHELNEEELLIVSNQIDYIMTKELIKEVGILKRLAYKFFFMFVQKHLHL
jgi:hypothetical protein